MSSATLQGGRDDVLGSSVMLLGSREIRPSVVGQFVTVNSELKRCKSNAP